MHPSLLWILEDFRLNTYRVNQTTGGFLIVEQKCRGKDHAGCLEYGSHSSS
jgi:hypothetical protein